MNTGSLVTKVLTQVPFDKELDLFLEKSFKKWLQIMFTPQSRKPKAPSDQHQARFNP